MNKTKRIRHPKNKSYLQKGGNKKNNSYKSSRKTKRSFSTIDNKKKSKIVVFFLEMLNVIKLYHWKTQSYSQHKATDELYQTLNEQVDKFVEILMGKDGSRIQLVEKNIALADLSETSNLKERIYEYREFLIDFTHIFSQKSDSDLLNIRDEILGSLNQFLYLLTLNGGSQQTH